MRTYFFFSFHECTQYCVDRWDVSLDLEKSNKKTPKIQAVSHAALSMASPDVLDMFD